MAGLGGNSVDGLIGAANATRPACKMALGSRVDNLCGLRAGPHANGPFGLKSVISGKRLVIHLRSQRCRGNVTVSTGRLDLRVTRRRRIGRGTLCRGNNIALDRVHGARMGIAGTHCSCRGNGLGLRGVGIGTPFSNIVISLPRCASSIHVRRKGPVINVVSCTHVCVSVGLPRDTVKCIGTSRPICVARCALPGSAVQKIVDRLSPTVDSRAHAFGKGVLVRGSNLGLHPNVFIGTSVIIGGTSDTVVVPGSIVRSGHHIGCICVIRGGATLLHRLGAKLRSSGGVRVLRKLGRGSGLIIGNFRALGRGTGMGIRG